MALNRIFIHRRDLSYSEVKKSESDIIFIRKDTLLEWAKEKYDYALTKAVELAYKTMVDKIESS